MCEKRGASCKFFINWDFDMIVIAFFWLFFSLIPAHIASSKGNSGIFIFIVSLLLSPLIGLIIAIISRPNQTVIDNEGIKSGSMKRCPYCDEVIKSKAVTCRYCNKDL